MPAIPVYRQQTSPGGGFRADLGPAGQGAMAIGQGVAAVADVLLRQREQDAAADAAVKLSTTQATWQQHLIERQQAWTPGESEFTPTLLADYDKYVDETVGQAKSRAARLYLRERLGAYRGDLAKDAITFEANANIADRQSKFQQSAEQVASLAEIEPDRYQARLAENLAALDALQVPPAVRTKMRADTIALVHERAAVGYARRDPTTTMQRLITPGEGDTLFRSLTPSSRDAVLKEVESQQRILLQAEDREYRRSERAEKDMNDAASKDGDRLLAAGELSTTWIERNRGRLSPSDYRYFNKALSGEAGGQRNLDTYIRLRDSAGRGLDVRDEARDALRRGQITLSDFDRVTSEVEQSRPGWYKRGTQYLSTVSGYSELNPTPDAAQSKANMLDDWSEWATANPKATEQQASAAFHEIAGNYLVLEMASLSVPKYLVGNRLAPNIDETERRTVEAFRNGAITREQFEREAALLKQWRRATEARGARSGGQ